jgi:murein DD-endopeptidase MepM/ murein hydrolase activator NlpD
LIYLASGLVQRALRRALVGLCVLLLFIFGTLTLVSAQDAAPPPNPALTATPIPRPAPSITVQQDRLTLEFFFPSLSEGQAGLLHLTGTGLAGARARFLDKLIDFFPVQNDGFYALLAVDMDQAARKYDLDIFAWFDDKSKQNINTQVEVTTGKFITQQVTLPADKAFLADPEIERDEFARLESILGKVTPEQLWDSGGFQMPIPGGELTSPFGAFRTFNGTVQTRHTGWDIKAALGQPIMASAAGKVAFAGPMQIRGNFVAIDHGYGIFTTYSHFSEVHVTRGQTISKGQIIGTVGNTGRTSGAHFHWEVAVNDVYIDSVQFMKMWLPGEG